MKAPLIYLIGSLRNPRLPMIGDVLREAGFDVFDSWFHAGPDADDCWKLYEKARGRSYKEALNGPAADCIFNFDLRWLTAADIAVLAMPAGRSAHLELGWMLGRGKPGYVLLDDAPRWDVMLRFANTVFESIDGMTNYLKERHLR